MDEKRYIFETVEITDDNGESRVVDVITDKEECYSYEDLCDIAVLLNGKEATIQQLEKENQRVYGIIEDGGVLLTEKQLLDVIGEDKVDMFFREQETSNKLQEIKADAETALLIIKAMQPLPFTISISEAKSLIRLSENVGELLDTEGD